MNIIKKRIKESVDVKNLISNDQSLIDTIHKVCEAITSCFKEGNRVFFCGNGGSAADAQHLAAELSGRYYLDRNPLPAEALHVNTSYLTAVANDYSFEQVYARYIEGMGSKGDVFIGFSTSGNSENIVNAAKMSQKNGLTVVGFTGSSGGKLAKYSDYLLNVPSNDTPRIQEAHILIGHIICEVVESSIFSKNE